MASRIMKRYGASQIFEHLDSVAYAHIVVGPDVEKVWQEKNTEDKPLPEKDFGGVLLSENAEFDGISSKDTWCNTPKRWKLMFSREPTIVRHFDKGEDVRGFNTGKEDAPWVQFKLDSVRKITGMQIDVYRGTWYACPFAVWTSTDGKQWYEVHKELQERSRYRIDLNRKNVKAKFIRIGRKPGFRNEHFSLHKILIYGK